MTKQLQKEFKKAIPKRKPDTHKGDYGHIFLICGSEGLTGAGILSARAALRSGAGLVTLGVPKSLNSIFETALLEVMSYPLRDGGKGFLSATNLKGALSGLEGKSTFGIGPGLGRHPETQRFVRTLFPKIDIPFVLDADGITAFKGHLDVLKTTNKNVVITPHPGEFDSVFGTSVKENPKRRKQEALFIANKYKITVVLKGNQTVVASRKGEVFVNPTGNPGMATGGTGDCLFGMVAAFLGRGISVFQAAKFAVYLHGLSGDLAVKKIGENSLIASDLIEYLPEAFQKILK